MSEERFKRVRSYFHATVAILFLLLVVYAARPIETEIKTEIPSLVELTIPAVVTYITQKAQSADVILKIINQVPANKKVAVLLRLFSRGAFQKLPLTTEDKLKIAYEGVKHGDPSSLELEQLINKSLIGADPCLFANKSINEIIPDEVDQPSQFGKIVMRALLKLPTLKLPEKKITEPLMRIFFTGHEIMTIPMISRDDRYVATILDDRSIFIWDIQRSKPAAFFDAQTEELTRLEWGPYNLLAAGSEQGKIYFWDVDQLHEPDVKLILPGKHAFFNEETGESDEDFMNVYRQYLTQLPEETRLSMQNFLVTLENIRDNHQPFLPATNILAVHTSVKNTKPVNWFIMRGIQSPQYTLQISENDVEIKSLFINEIGSYLAVALEDGIITAWDITDLAAPIKTFTHQAEPGATGISITNDGTIVAIAPQDTQDTQTAQPRVVLLNTQTGMEINSPGWPQTDSFYTAVSSHTLALSSDAGYLASQFAVYFNLINTVLESVIARVDKKHYDASGIFNAITFDQYGVQSLASCKPAPGPTTVYSLPYNGNLEVVLPEWAGFPQSFGNASLVTEEFDEPDLSKITIWQLPLNYLYGHFTWSQLRDLLKPHCWAIVPK